MCRGVGVPGRRGVGGDGVAAGRADSWRAVGAAAAGPGGLARGGVLARGGAGLGQGEVSGLPEQEYLFEAGEDAGQAGHDEGVDGVGQHSPVRILRCGGTQTSELVGQGGGLCLHGSYITNCYTYCKRFLR